MILFCQTRTLPPQSHGYAPGPRMVARGDWETLREIAQAMIETEADVLVLRIVEIAWHDDGWDYARTVWAWCRGSEEQENAGNQGQLPRKGTDE